MKRLLKAAIRGIKGPEREKTDYRIRVDLENKIYERIKEGEKAIKRADETKAIHCLDLVNELYGIYGPDPIMETRKSMFLQKFTQKYAR